MPLRLDLLRHGAAESSHPDGDRGRRLTPAGRDAVRALGERLATEAWKPDQVLSSPYARAIETAEILLRAASVDLPVERSDALVPEPVFRIALGELEALIDGARHVLLVTHQPLVGMLVRHWSGNSAAFGPGDMVTMEFDGGLGRHVARARRVT